MLFTHKADLSDATVQKLAQAWQLPVIPQEKIPELMDAAIALMYTATALLKLALVLAPITVVGMLVIQLLGVHLL